MSRKMTGIEIGNYSAKLALCTKQGLAGALAAPLPDNVVKESRVASPVAAGEQLRTMRRTFRGASRSAALSLPPRLAVSRLITVPAMGEQELALNLPYEFRDFLPGKGSDYYYDYIVQGVENDGSGKPEKLKLFACAVPRAEMDSYFALLRSAGFRLKTAIPPEAALLNLIRGRKDLPEELAVADIGHTTTSVYFFRGGCFAAAKEIETGSRLVDEAVAYEKNVDIHVARSYKENNLENAQRLESCMNAYGSIAVEIMKALNFYAYENRDSALADVYCCGGGSGLEPLLEAISRSTEKKIHKACELVPGASPENIAVPACIFAAGAAMQGVR